MNPPTISPLVVSTLVIISVSIPTFISVNFFNVNPNIITVLLLGLVGISAVHPYLGFPNIAQLAGLEEPKAVQQAPKEIKPVQQTFDKPDPFIGEYPALRDRLIDLADTEKHPIGKPDSIWKQVLTQEKGDYTISVQKQDTDKMFFRIVVDFEASPEQTFDHIADITTRNTWDEICQSSGIVERVSAMTAVQFMRTKGIFPTAPRSALVVGFISKLDDGRYINVTRSVDSHPDYKIPSGDVCMTADIAGLIVGPHPSGNPKRSRCVQIVTGDLGGWLPASVVNIVTTQAFPISMRRANSQMKKNLLDKKTSSLIEESLGNVAIAEQKKQTQVAQDSFIIKLLKGLQKSQPIMVFIILLIAIFKRK
ncbi:hypothetical protein HK103_000559 [Boothiomyces macroporosus]|uniref:START domain-containing protein n=1 Tax=Boothiomyces macroporosus TaxID=261099 RepID=A0AAD5YA42_9FUNG|nr:hypothetical protein HK103_000559 [Boothiomyces macroporosus]